MPIGPVCDPPQDPIRPKPTTWPGSVARSCGANHTRGRFKFQRPTPSSPFLLPLKTTADARTSLNHSTTMTRPLLHTRRLAKELRDLSTNPPEGLTVVDADDFRKWRLSLDGAPGTLYEFRFTADYPLESPEVVFVYPEIPLHPQYIPMATYA
ncbi:hypothetical protein BC937DRAFT_94737 [Endogone sp. FLAS-F59071]|nr:hypothetical protein BC937DRAFT_94737 [Endogone sp. FLAS-F59071]|eukprot:RUS20630.1 hypothetical protein BC937DRAFT_94737 [Endogone sp. FLAS-F59071]